MSTQALSLQGFLHLPGNNPYDQTVEGNCSTDEIPICSTKSVVHHHPVILKRNKMCRNKSFCEYKCRLHATLYAALKAQCQADISSQGIGQLLHKLSSVHVEDMCNLIYPYYILRQQILIYLLL
jgi:hypothetical protein